MRCPYEAAQSILLNHFLAIIFRPPPIISKNSLMRTEKKLLGENSLRLHLSKHEYLLWYNVYFYDTIKWNNIQITCICNFIFIFLLCLNMGKVCVGR